LIFTSLDSRWKGKDLIVVVVVVFVVAAVAALDGIPSFIIKGCSDNFILLLAYICNHSVARLFHPCGFRLLLFQYSRKVALQYLTVLREFSGLLFTSVHVVFLIMDVLPPSMAFLNIIPPHPVWFLIFIPLYSGVHKNKLVLHIFI
jgi:hypothetical protein